MATDLPISREGEAFRQFVNQQIDAAGQHLSPESLLEAWRAHHPSKKDLDESLEAINRALVQLASGETGREARELIAESRHALAGDR